jgi:transcription termination factor Rho
VLGSSSKGVFLSYRREDAAPYARLLQIQLSQRIPEAQVFIDLDSIEPGLDFAEVIREAVDSCAVLVALIGHQWVTLADEEGRRRVDNPDDYVRFEIQTALERGVRVIPVLVNGAKPLQHQQLPIELHKFARLNAFELSYSRYEYDAGRLLDLIQRVLAEVRDLPGTDRPARSGPIVAQPPPEQADRQEKEQPEGDVQGQLEPLHAPGQGEELPGQEPDDQKRQHDTLHGPAAPSDGRFPELATPAASEPVITEDDVLIPIAGILDVLDNYGFVHTTGYFPGPNDVYVLLSQVRKHGLRKGDVIEGAVRQPREGERREKFNVLVRLAKVNGLDPEQSRTRPDFAKLVPLYPQERLRLESDPANMTTRIIDLIAPIGKGQRGLIVAPPKAGTTLILQAIANAITKNNPECHLMVVLVDERPEEVTHMQRSVRGEVIYSRTNDPVADQLTVADLAIERAKRLAEMGHDVVVLLDSITRLGRAYKQAAPDGGQIMPGTVDSASISPPKRFFGAARNIERGGSLTVLATVLIETGFPADEMIFEEFKGTGNMQLRLRGELADKRIFPAVDVIASGTRKEELLMSRDELKIVRPLRQVLRALEPQLALGMVLERMKQTKSNAEFLLQWQKTTSGS